MGEINIDTFRRRVGATLHVEQGDIHLRLTEVTELRPDAYSVLFEGPAEPVLSQATYTLRAVDGTSLVVFMVPLGPGADAAMVYEAVFTTAPPAAE